MSKPALTYSDQLAKLKSRGLLVPDEPFALHVLEHHNYYRLSIYRFPFTTPGNPDQFLAGATFTQIWDLYHFDRTLRRLVLDACKRIEISVRSRWAYEISHRHGPESYVDNRHFSDPLVHARTLVKLEAEMTRSNEKFVSHHRAKLQTPWPPAWVVAEVASFGNTSNLVGGLRDPSLRQAIADTYTLDEKTFCSLLHHLCVLRNTAAHHSRLWNREFKIKFQLPKKKPAHLHPNFHTPPGPQNLGLIHNSLILIIHLLRCIEPDTHWPSALLASLRQLDPARLADMGFPPDWENRPLWNTLVAASAGPVA